MLGLVVGEGVALPLAMALDPSFGGIYHWSIYPPGPFGGRAARPIRKDGLSFLGPVR